jgi:glucose-6-phosphate 1-dehydrogenase
MRVSQDADALILFGITGHLARTSLFPALYELSRSDVLDIPVVGVASSDLDDDELRQRARESLEDSGVDIDEGQFEKLAARLSYVSGDYQDEALYPRIASQVKDCKLPVSYLAIPPATFEAVVNGLADTGLARNGRLVVEKPFGRDSESAAELNETIHSHFPEDSVYRIDHFLGKEAVQNLMIFRFANTILEPIWNRHYVRGVQITLAEDFGIEGRGKFYDSVGAIRDVVQNHMLQMVALLAMEPPVSDDPDALRDERAKVLQAVKTVESRDVVRGQYQGYLDEPHVESGSDTETYVALRLEIDSWRWAGVPWIVRTGKRLARTVTEAAVEFQSPPRPLFAPAGDRPQPNRLVFRTKPDNRITLSMEARVPGKDLVSGPVELHVEHDHPASVAPYTRLLRDALRGDMALFARADGVMEAWRVLDPVLVGGGAPDLYPPESWGPEAADDLLGDLDWITV